MNKDSLVIHRTQTKEGNVIKGTFRAKENYLGIIQIKFKSSKNTNSRLVFRFKEEGKNGYIYTNTINSSNIDYLPFYPFGIPPIQDSKNKTYTFELTTQNKFIDLSDEDPIIILQYHFPKELLLHNRSMAMHFIFAKLNYYYTHEHYLKPALFFQIPFILYTGFILFQYLLNKCIEIGLFSDKRVVYLGEIFKKLSPMDILKKYHISLLTLSFLMTDIAIIQQLYSYFTFISIGLLIITIYVFKIKNTVLLFSCIILMTVFPLFLMLGFIGIAEKIALWAFIFLLITAVSNFLRAKD
jgi:hypothetical protein